MVKTLSKEKEESSRWDKLKKEWNELGDSMICDMQQAFSFFGNDIKNIPKTEWKTIFKDLSKKWEARVKRWNEAMDKCD